MVFLTFCSQYIKLWFEIPNSLTLYLLTLNLKCIIKSKQRFIVYEKMIRKILRPSFLSARHYKVMFVERYLVYVIFILHLSHIKFMKIILSPFRDLNKRFNLTSRKKRLRLIKAGSCEKKTFDFNV